jgi:putative nucleotidyltransferase with HDIG domain
VIAALDEHPRVRAAREALAGTDAFIVGGTVRDALLSRPVVDLDLAVPGDPQPAARALGRAANGAVFQLSEQFGAWRVVARDDGFVFDVSPLQGATIEQDLTRRDFAANAIAVPLAGGDPIDPTGGLRDVETRTLRVLGGDTVATSSYALDALRPLRLVRLAAELGFEPDARTERLTLEAAHAVDRASAERVFAELRRLMVAERAVEGLELSDRLGVTAAILPEVAALHGVEQSHFHHLDVYGHTIEVLREQIRIERDPESVFGAELGPRVADVLAEPLADELTRAGALRFAALLHDIAKPATRRELGGGRVSFIGHDAVGEEVIAEICRRLRTSERLREFLGAIARHHLVLGFLVHERPLGPAGVYRYLATTSPVEIEVTVLSCADRLATRGKNAERAIGLHVELARELMAAALDWRASGPPKPAVRGNRLARELGIEPGPELGELMGALAEAAYTGEATTPEQAVEYARRLRENQAR